MNRGHDGPSGPVAAPLPVPLMTARLVLLPLAIEDSAAVQAVFPQWEIVRFLADVVPWPYPPDGALTYVRDKALPAVVAGQEWHWSIRPGHAPRR